MNEQTATAPINPNYTGRIEQPLNPQEELRLISHLLASLVGSQNIAAAAKRADQLMRRQQELYLQLHSPTNP